MSTEKSTRVVIIGAGFGGLSAALEFGKHAKTANIDVTIIDRNNYQLFTPILYEIASASRSIRNEEHLKKTVCLDVHMALGMQGVRFLQATVQNIDSQQRTVTTDVEELEYDYLLVALGSEPFYFGIDGMKEHSLAFKWIGDAIAIRSSIQNHMHAMQKTRVLVCGGGPAGVELAAELMQEYKTEVSKKEFSTVIVDTQPHILGNMGERIQRSAEHALTRLGVEQETNFRITNAKEEKGKQVLTSDDGKTLEGDVMIWTGGIAANPLLQQTDIALTKRGQIATHKTMQSKDDERVFAVGDVIECEMMPDHYTAQTAHEAVLQGPVAARNIIAHATGKPLEDHKQSYAGLIITLGGKRGLVELPGGFVLTGFLGWLARKFVDFRHFRSVLPFMQACSIWYQGMRTTTKND